MRSMATANQRDWPGSAPARAGAGYLDIDRAVYGNTTRSANTHLRVSQLLTAGPEPVNASLNWNSVNWNSDDWGQ